MKDKISVCIASIPHRRYSLEDAINSLLPQVDAVYLFLNNYSESDVEQIKQICSEKIEYIIGDNKHSDASKFYWADKLSGFILTADDDIVYPSDYAKKIIEGIEKYARKSIVSFHGRTLKFPMDSYYRDYSAYFGFNNKLAEDVFVHIAGTGCMGWHSSSISVSMNDFPSPNMADIHISILAQKNKVPVAVLAHEENWIQGTYSPVNSISSKMKNNDSEQTERVRTVDWKLYKIMHVKKPSECEINPTSAYVINLARRTDRYKSVFYECEKNNIVPIRIEAINGRSEFPPHAGSRLMRSHYGCLASHIKALKVALGNGNEYSLIIEDDCVLDGDFKDRLKMYATQLPPEWELLYLGGSLIDSSAYEGGSLIKESAAEKFSDNLYRAKKVLTTHAYIIRNSSIQKLIDVISSEKNKIDLLFCKFQKASNCFIVYPELAWQKAGHSDIVGTVRGNAHLRYGSVV